MYITIIPQLHRIAHYQTEFLKLSQARQKRSAAAAVSKRTSRVHRSRREGERSTILQLFGSTRIFFTRLHFTHNFFRYTILNGYIGYIHHQPNHIAHKIVQVVYFFIIYPLRFVCNAMFNVRVRSRI